MPPAELPLFERWLEVARRRRSASGLPAAYDDAVDMISDEQAVVDARAALATWASEHLTPAS
jgi:hypothetical protein